MRQKKKRVAKAQENRTVEELWEMKEKIEADGGEKSLDESVYSYYTEKTDLDAELLGQSFGGTSPDKLAMSTANTNNIGAENV